MSFKGYLVTVFAPVSRNYLRRPDDNEVTKQRLISLRSWRRQHLDDGPVITVKTVDKSLADVQAKLQVYC